jgi:tetratricopeptide (TPR) repeat protein
VVCFLIIPEIRQKANSDATAQVVTANETISTREQTIKNLESEIEGLNEQVETANAATSTADEKTESYEKMLNAYVSYSDEEFVQAGESLKEVNKDLLSDDAKAIYDRMLDEVEQAMLKATMDEALNLYEQKNYTEAIEKFKEVVAVDEGYESGKAAYYLAFAYMYEEDNDNALKWFKITVEHTNSGSTRRTAKGIIEDLESMGATVPGEDAESSDGQDAGADEEDTISDEN